MSKAVVRIFSYLPNPRVLKSLIAADICGVAVEVLGDSPTNLATWLWDFDARKLSPHEMSEDSPNLRIGKRGYKGKLFKSDRFLEAHPFATVPAAFDPSGEIGIFESNSILRSVVRSSSNDQGLYGINGYEASRIDSFLDAGLVFAREAQVYLLSMSEITVELYDRMSMAFEFYLNGIDATLNHSEFLCGDSITIADISFACDFAQFLREQTMNEDLQAISKAPISCSVTTEFPNAYGHLHNLAAIPEFAKHISPLMEKLPEPLV